MTILRAQGFAFAKTRKFVAVTIGTNIESLSAQRKLLNTESRLGTVFERLASGQRINRASDDAAGLAVADALRSDSRLYSQSIRNINDGISVLNVMDSALGSQADILVRLKEIAEQSANGVYGYEQRRALQNEYESLIDEFSRIAEATTFNGINLLSDVDGASLALQVGIGGDADSLINLMLQEASASSGTLNVYGDVNEINGITIDDLLATLGQSGISMTIDEIQEFFLGSALISETLVDNNGEERNVLLLASEVQNFAGPGLNSLTAIAFVEDPEGETFTFNSIYGLNNGDVAMSTPQTISFINDAGLLGVEYTFDFTDTTLNSAYYDGEVAETAIEFTNVLSQGTSRHALTVLDNRLSSLSAIRGEIGATQSRLDVAQNVSSIAAETLKAAESRVRDADIARESSELVRLRTLQQAASALLAQANLQPQLALTLLS